MRTFPRGASAQVAVYRLPDSGDRKYPSTPTSTIEGALVALNKRDHTLEGNMYVKEFELFVDATADIQTSDKLIINSTTYFVRRILPYSQGRTPMQYVNLSTAA